MSDLRGSVDEHSAIGYEFDCDRAIPDVFYSAEQDELWSQVFGALTEMHEEFACEQYSLAARRVALATDRVPQLGEVSRRLTSTTGFTLAPVTGLVPSRPYYAPFADNILQVTQNLRPVSAQYYSPKPDVIHDLVGHAVTLADADFASIYRWFGRAAQCADSIAAMEVLSRLFWFSMETGVVMENGTPRACGAAILSSVAEMQSFRHAELRGFCVEDMIAQSIDDSDCQPVLFVAESVTHLLEEVKSFLGSVIC
ncbi:UNVERIFIED_CONTAM: phenylalanine-4-hydroxylase [Williamsia faeni]